MLQKVSASDIEAYAIPTTENWVCYVIADEIGAGCIPGLQDGISVSISEGRDPLAVATRSYEDSARVLVFGLAIARVTTIVAIDSHGARHNARMGENAYVIELPAGSQVDSLEVTYDDGTTQLVAS